MIRLSVLVKWASLAVCALAFGWTIGGHLDGFSLAGVVGLASWKMADLFGAEVEDIDDTHPEALSRLDRLDGVGSGR